MLTLGSAPGKGGGAALRGKEPDPGPALCGDGSSAARRGVGQQQACVTGKRMGWGEGTSKHSGSLARVDWWRLPPNSWLEGTQRIQGKEGSVQHIQLCPGTDGKAGPGKEPAPPAVQQADGKDLP